ncbi:MAG: hypothetical protein SXV54_05460 [Chloroflexota bacterium]|nr:hypothetical protein [Chloroflexota bacterium]
MLIAAPRYRRVLHPPASGRIGSDNAPAWVESETVDNIARAVGVGIGWVVGSGLVGGVGFFVGDGDGDGGNGDGVRVRTVCRAGLCPGAAHRSGPAISAIAIIADSTSQNTDFFLFMLFIALS